MTINKTRIKATAEVVAVALIARIIFFLFLACLSSSAMRSASACASSSSFFNAFSRCDRHFSNNAFASAQSPIEEQRSIAFFSDCDVPSAINFFAFSYEPLFVISFPLRSHSAAFSEESKYPPRLLSIFAITARDDGSFALAKNLFAFSYRYAFLPSLLFHVLPSLYVAEETMT